jgi:hypothetical protein
MSETFKPSYEKKQFSIVIDVYENGLAFIVTPAEKSPMYYETLGALHQTVFSIMENQREEARKEFAKHKKKSTN